MNKNSWCAPFTTLQVAEFLGVSDCTEACAYELYCLDDAALPFGAVMALPANDVFGRLVAKARRLLLVTFGDALAVMQDPVTLAQLVELPPEAMLYLLKGNNLKTDSEPTVVTMAWAWYDHNRLSCSCKQLASLKKLLRYGWLPPLFISSVLQQLPEFRPTQEQTNVLWLASAPGLDLKRVDAEDACPKGWFLPERPRSTWSGTSIRLGLDVSRSALLQHMDAVAKMRAGGPAPQTIRGEKVYAEGYVWDLSLSSNNCEEALVLSLGFASPLNLPKRVAAEMTSKFLSGVTIGTPGTRGKLWSDDRAACVGMPGMCDAEVVLGGDCSLEPWAAFIQQDGGLRWEAEVTVHAK